MEGYYRLSKPSVFLPFYFSKLNLSASVRTDLTFRYSFLSLFSSSIFSVTATNEGSVPMAENEEMQILEQDQGDGWTRVRKTDGDEGFVPTSYIECHYYDVDQV